MSVLTESDICGCKSLQGAAPRNEEGLITHGECGLVKRTVVFHCSACDTLSASPDINYVTDDIYHCYHCPDCVEALELDPIECSKKRCHNWPQ